MTVSEKCFVDYCYRRGYAVEAIERQPNVRKTADFRVTAHGHRAIVEIKELISNDEVRPAYDPDPNRKPKKSSDVFADRARTHIAEAAEQLRSYRSEGLPLVGVLYDNIQLNGRRHPFPYIDLDAGQIDAGMYGYHREFPTIVSGRGTPRKKPRIERLMTSEEKRYVSAVCVLYDIPELQMRTYHNFYAKVPLPAQVFSGQADLHLMKPADPAICPGEWIAYTSSD